MSSSASSARATALSESRFLSALSGWKLANQQLDELGAAISTLDAQREELELVGDELARLEEDALLYRAVGPVLNPITLQEARSSHETRSKNTSEELTRLRKRERLLAEQQRERRQQLQQQLKQLPHIPQAIFDV